MEKTDFKVGDTVRLRADVKEPEFGWPSTIPRDGVFEIIEVMNFAVSVKLPRRKGHWDIAIDEIELAPPQPDPRDAEIAALKAELAAMAKAMGESMSRNADEDRLYYRQLVAAAMIARDVVPTVLDTADAVFAEVKRREAKGGGE